MQTVFHILHWICNSYGIQIPPIVSSRHHRPTCLKMRIKGGGVDDDHYHHRPNPNDGVRGGLNRVGRRKRMDMGGGGAVYNTSKDYGGHFYDNIYLL